MESTTSNKSESSGQNREEQTIETSDACYVLGAVLGEGSFGEIRLATKVDDGTTVAVKLEHGSAKTTLGTEARMYELLGKDKGVGFAKFYGTARLDSSEPNRADLALILELLGPSLEDYFVKCKRRFSDKTVLQIAIQLMDRFEALHSAKILFRDVKPENFLVGHRDGPNTGIIHMVDFGLAKTYITKDGDHLPEATGRGSTGTMRYMSVNAHSGFEQSRRDDLTSAGYMFLYFLRGSLPWQGMIRKLKRRNPGKAVTNKETMVEICKVKQKTSVAELCAGQLDVFAKFLRLCRLLEFAQRPNYGSYRTIFEDALNANDHVKDWVFDWDAPLAEEEEVSLVSNADVSSTPTMTIHSNSKVHGSRVSPLSRPQSPTTKS